jgi:hypothetical protein
MVNMSDELKTRNLLKLILIVRFACATLDVGHPIQPPIICKSKCYAFHCYKPSMIGMDIIFFLQLHNIVFLISFERPSLLHAVGFRWDAVPPSNQRSLVPRTALNGGV